MAIVAWVVPLGMVLLPWILGPDLSKPKSEFPSTSFIPVEVKAIGKNGSKGSDHFELWLTSPDHNTYFLRDPEPEPIAKLRDLVPEGKELNIVYWNTVEGNVLMEIAEASSPAHTLLSFDERVAEYASRHRMVYLTSGIWFIVGTAIFVFLWKTRTTRLDTAS